LKENNAKPLFIFMVVLIIATGAMVVRNIYSAHTIISGVCADEGSDQNLILRIRKKLSDLKISGAVFVAKGNEVLARSYCGSADPANKIQVSEKTQFNIGSVTKQFTGYVTLELIREGLITPTAPIFEYLPELREKAVGKVTVEQLTHMRSGLPYILPKKDFLSLQLSNRIRSEQEMIDAIGSLELEFPPGEKFSYSNLGYSLLGAVIARVEKSSWSEALRKRIFEPFKMTNTTTEGDHPEPPSNLATGLIPFRLFSNTLFLKLPHWNYSMIKGAGGIVSTVNDLHLWNLALSERSIRDLDWAKVYFPTGPANDEDYSYGWFLSESNLAGGRTIQTINHGGEDPGYCAVNIRVPSLDAQMIITTNSDYCALRDGAYKSLIEDATEYLVGKYQ
jgi:CubicO group peptidase (beta-lactamase class C family)